jgi:hypothetical protein
MLKTVSSITNVIGALNYKGTWNANTNTPTLASGAVEILRFSPDVYFSGVVAAASDVYMTPGEGL